MAVQLRYVSDTPMSQRLEIREHVLTVDSSVAEGGQDAGPNPHDLYDSALGACKALTVLWYAQRKGLPLWAALGGMWQRARASTGRPSQAEAVDGCDGV